MMSVCCVPEDTCLCLCGVQEEKLVDRDVAVWRLHGDATVLITLAHIFNHFAPLMVTPPPLFVLCVR